MLNIYDIFFILFADSMSNSDKIPTFAVTESSNKASHSGCIVRMNNTTQLYDINEDWRESDCISCRCVGQGQTLCTKETCQLPPCVNAVKIPGVCCHTCFNAGQ